MRVYARILLLFTFALAFARANVFAQDRSGLDDARFVTLAPQIVLAFLDHCISDSLHWKNNFTLAAVSGDSLVLLQFIHSHSGIKTIFTSDGSLAKTPLQDPFMIKVAKLTRHIEVTETSTPASVRTASMDISVGSFVGMQPPRYFTSTVTIFRDTIRQLGTSAQEKPKTFWESTAEPVLVTLGAAVIVALFFIIRS
ncbi:MAG TPA: hypothetical protein VEW28_08760 [Candidatus Kapabacteria bacterium]|nr:hypothetical protein [Candidatus Kapabacteria bacterium]